jgi:hypothetical protein
MSKGVTDQDSDDSNEPANKALNLLRSLLAKAAHKKVKRAKTGEEGWSRRRTPATKTSTIRRHAQTEGESEKLTAGWNQDSKLLQS